MDKSLRPEEQAVVFKMVDKNNDGNVAIEEFKKLFI
jgi:Ca2+-binding EF-hand superfamily protein